MRRIGATTVRLYLFDLRWGGECFLDEEGIAHFDEGSAIYYAQRIADRIGRDADYGSLRVDVRSRDGVLLATIAPSDGRGRERFALIGGRQPGSFRYASNGVIRHEPAVLTADAAQMPAP
jgi:hypothetical protein